MRSSQRSRIRRPSSLSLPYRTAGNLWDPCVRKGWDPHRDHGDGGSHRSHSHTGRLVTSEIPVFAEDEILTEITETEVMEVVTAFTPIQDSRKHLISECLRSLRFSQRSRRRRPLLLPPYRTAGNLWDPRVCGGWDPKRDHGDGGHHRSYPHTGWKVISEISVFAGDEILTEIMETEAVTALTPIWDGR